MSRLSLGLLVLLLFAACDDEGVVGVDPTSGRTVTATSAADLPLGYRPMCDPGACGSVPSSAGSGCGEGRYDGASCLSTDVDGTSCVWMDVPCADVASGLTGDAGSAPPSSDGGLSSSDAGLPAADAGGGSSDGGTADGGPTSSDAGMPFDPCSGACTSPPPDAPTCFTGAPALVVCGSKSTGGCGWLFRCGAP